MDSKEVLNQLRDSLGKRPDIDTLKMIRAMLDDAGFLPEMVDDLRRMNDRADVINGLVALKRDADDMSHRRKTQTTAYFLVTGTGGTAMVGSIALVATAVSGFFILPLFLGLTVATHGYISAIASSEEERIYSQIAERLGAIENAIEEKLK
ncbi:hypothetical protein IVB45_04530 [Bradyrhizobium sp. 4]|uniref:hypothetical protein n=1 Tax=unclassified Bradyrhizobium TaxID=2631580 RepID=UPI001FFABAB1|nr:MULTISPECIES: hypothetical protein [unclassified Bradyrhizobium]MCK1400529.1 hypothetical protein [Bradyrhizobium sp. 39]MCK1632653.1 hypothetical protein [Bradyrhizobium sp. 162]MCK1749442.1 hypothetical protein [Bradyrhizobium sp. 135]UPJ36265.1 hypothetical protein IVB45_04530 [Bradyrhizobium sp. 4]